MQTAVPSLLQIAVYTALLLDCHGKSADGTPPLPSPRQKTYIEWGHEMFIHFSITTFTGSQEGDQDPTLFAPDNTTLNVSQWVETAVKGGFPVATLTTKHEAGFAIWPTKVNSNYSILMSPTVGHRDLVQEFVDECRKQGILPGFYFTTGARPCDIDCQRAQITELASNYGNISYWWFDHHNNDPVHEMLDQVVAAHIPTAARLGPDSWVTADESGFAPYPLFNQCNTTDGTIYARCPGPADSTGSPFGKVFKAWESSCSIYTDCHPWFPGGSDGELHPSSDVMSLNQIMARYEASWGRGTNMILNLPPEKNGLIADDVVAAGVSFAEERKRRYEVSVIHSLNASISPSGDNSMVAELSRQTCIDRILLAESALTIEGQKVLAYTLQASNQTSGDSWVTLELNSDPNGTCPEMQYARCGGGTIGLHHVDILDPPVSAVRIRLLLNATIVPNDTVKLSMKILDTSATNALK